MTHLTRYLVGRFARDALILFGVVSFLLWMVQCLRVFDVVSVKGQGLLTLAAQGLLTMPPLVLTFAFVCVGIGLARALVALQTSHELHIIHTSAGFGSLVRATGMLAVGSALAIMVISHLLAPLAERQLTSLSASITADLVSSTLQPGRFTQVSEGVVLLIGGRAGNGEITEFFADDRRDPETRRTYIAEAATIARTPEGYVLRLENGSIQSASVEGRFAEVRFGQYEINVDRFTQAVAAPNPIDSASSPALLATAIGDGVLRDDARRALIERTGEGLKVIGMCLIVLGLAGFPSGRRGRAGPPMEVLVLVIAFCELAISSYGAFGPELGPVGGSLVMTVVGASILAWRARRRSITAVAVPT